MKARQRIRRFVLFLIFLTFPITLNYFSVYLIIEAGAQGIANFSFFFWSLWTVAGLIVGRAGCCYICPLGAIQETADRMILKNLIHIKYLKVIKYILAVLWVSAVIMAIVSAGGYKSVHLLYNTEKFVSVDSLPNLMMYFSIVLAVLIPALIFGKRGFCHYLCPWGVLNIAGTKIKTALKYPSLCLKAEADKCKNCGTCDRNCTMSLNVSKIVKSGSMRNTECILCGACVDTCPNSAIMYSWHSENELI